MLFVCVSSLAIEARAVAESPKSIPGRLIGSFSSTDNGAGSYRIPIKVPPGIAGMAPSVSIAYSSQNGNDVAGMGWSVRGVSAISRCPANREVDGFKGAINYDDNDRYCLDGQRLIAVKGAYGQHLSEYRTELETWERIVAYYDKDGTKACGSGPCYFVLTAKNGVRHIYGQASARILAVGKSDVRVWALHRSVDLNGNAISFSYAADPLGGNKSRGAYYISRIDYTGNKQAKVAPNRAVVFEYERRPDTITHYVGGAPITKAARLAYIHTYLGSSLIKEYRFVYDKRDAGRSLLVSVSECNGAGIAASSSCLTPTRFGWQRSAARFASKTTALSDEFGKNQGWSSSRGMRFLSDVNGDGRTDIVGFKDGVKVALSDGKRYKSATTWSSDFDQHTKWDVKTTPRMLADVNGDGMSDVVGFGLDGVHVALSTRTRFDSTLWQQKPYPYFCRDCGKGWLPKDTPRMIADVNGDGRGDLVGFGIDGVYVALSLGNKFQDKPQRWTTQFGRDSAPGWGAQTPRLLVDINGDRMADIVGFGQKGVYIALSTGDRGNSFVTPKWASQPMAAYGTDQGWSNNNVRSLADVNGDGLTDIVGINHSGVFVSLSTGQSFLPQPQSPWPESFKFPSASWSVASTPLQMIDVNADGHADLVGFGADAVVVALSNGSGFSTANWDRHSLPGFGGPDWGAQTPRMLADVNGDGLTDVLGFGLNGVQVGLASGPYPDLMNSVTNGFGLSLQMTYKPISDPSVYSFDAEQHQSANAPGVINASMHSANFYPIAGVAASTVAPRNVWGGRSQVVALYRERNDETLSQFPIDYAYDYHYSHARVDVGGHGWLGYKKVTHTNEQTGAVTVRTYHQDFPLTHRLIERQELCGQSEHYDPKCTASASPLGVTNADYEVVTTATGTSPSKPKVYDVRLQTSRVDHFSYGKYNFSIGEQHEYDDFGNRIRHSYLGYVDQTGKDRTADDNVYTLLSYVPPGKDWKLNYVEYIKKSKQSESDPIGRFSAEADISLTRYQYSDDGRMNLTSKGRWDDTNDVFLAHSFGYDAFGNRTSSMDPAGGRHDITFESKYHTYPATIKWPVVESGAGLCDQNTRLCEHYAYDARIGKKIGEIDRNGNTTVTCYDDFGSQTLIQGPIPEKPNGIRSDVNCLADYPYLVAGAPFVEPIRSAKVVSLQRADTHLVDGGIVRQRDSLQQWPTGDTRKWLSQQQWLDPLGRTYRTGTQTPGGLVYVDYKLDSDGRKVKQSLPYYKDNAQPTWAHSTYDIYGRPLQQTRPIYADGADRNTVMSYEYQGTSDGLHTTVIRAAEQSGKYAQQFAYAYFNGSRKVVSMVVPSEDNAQTSYWYDRLGRPLSATDPKTRDNPKGLTSTTSYDSLGRHKTTSNPAHGQATFRYDTQGRLIHKIDANGQFTFTHDAVGRMTSKLRPDGYKVAFTFDRSQAERANALGRRTAETLISPNGKVVNRYDHQFDVYGNKRQTTVTISGEAKAYDVARVYSPAGKVTHYTYPDGAMQVLSYDVGQLDNLSLDGKPFARFSDYTASGVPTAVTYGNGVVNRYQVSDTAQLLRQTVAQEDSSALLDVKYQWNGLAQLTAIDDLLEDDVNRSETFGYTDLRLTSSNAPGTYGSKTFRYDPSGNLTLKDGVTFHYKGYAVQSGTKDGESIFKAEYDPVGNLTTKEVSGRTWRYQYNAENRLTKAWLEGKPASVQVQLGYDFAGNRVNKIAEDGTRYVYIDNAYVIERTPGGAVRTTKYVRGPQGPIATVMTDSLVYHHRNHLDSTVLTSDETGRALKRFSYLPFGALVGSTAQAGFDFTGKRLDADTGLYYFGARYYDATLGRFITSDSGLGAPKTRPGAFNRYAYVLNSPSNYNDPTGNWACPKPVAGVVGGVLGAGTAVAGAFATWVDIGQTEKSGVNGDWASVFLGIGGVLFETGGGAALFYGGCHWLNKHLLNPPTDENIQLENLGDAIENMYQGAGLRITQLEEEVHNLGNEIDDLKNELHTRTTELDDAIRGKKRYRNKYRKLNKELEEFKRNNHTGDDCSCFAAGTQIATATGLRAIESIRPGDQVWSWNRDTHLRELKPVVKLVRAPRSKPLMRIGVGNGSVEATPSHPFWSTTQKTWIRAEKLSVGDHLLNADGREITVSEIGTRVGEFKVYNFEVADNHSYFVSEAEVLVHNSSCIGEHDGLGGKTDYGTGETAEVGADQMTADATREASSAVQTGVKASTATTETAETTTEGSTAVEETLELLLLIEL
nr:polymorphic toxin-type HINT domain-containing protein [Microbulbifer rhizosphaerae]